MKYDDILYRISYSIHVYILTVFEVKFLDSYNRKYTAVTKSGVRRVKSVQYFLLMHHQIKPSKYEVHGIKLTKH